MRCPRAAEHETESETSRDTGRGGCGLDALGALGAAWGCEPRTARRGASKWAARLLVVCSAPGGVARFVCTRGRCAAGFARAVRWARGLGWAEGKGGRELET